MKIAIGCDHAGFKLKEHIKKALEESKINIKDFGTYSEESTDYPDYAHGVALEVESKNADFGVLICGSGNGINMTANKHQGIRAALCWKAEIAELSRQHNNANIISLPARYISEQEGIEMVKTFINTPFEGGRHQKRVEKISC